MPVSPLWKRKPTSNRSHARANSTHAADAAELVHVGDDRVGRAERDRLAQVGQVRRERRAGGRSQRRHLLLRLDRVLVVADVVGVEPAQRVAGGRHRPAAVRVEAQLAVGADRGAHLAHHRHLLVQRDGRDLALEAVGVVLGDHARAVPGDVERASPRPAPTGPRAAARSTPSARRGCGRRRPAACCSERPSARPRASQSAISMPPNTRRWPSASSHGEYRAFGTQRDSALVEVEDVDADQPVAERQRRRRAGRRRRSRPVRRRPRR